MVASDLYYDVAYNGELEQSDFFPLLFHFFILSFSPENSLLFYCCALDALCNRLLCYSSGLCLYAVFHIIQTFLKDPRPWNSMQP